MSDTKVGTIITGEAQRDAIHMAIAPMVAVCTLHPGQEIGLVEDAEHAGAMSDADKAMGIVDPFLKHPVFKGERFWMFLYPNSVTGMRHEWQHPAFSGAVITSGNDAQKKKSERWLIAHATDLEMPYEDLMAAAARYLKTGQDTCLGYDTPSEVYSRREEFWKHYEVMTGEKPADTEETFFRCAC